MSEENDKDGNFNAQQSFELEKSSKINTKLGSGIMNLSVYKKHPFFSWKFKLISESKINLNRLLNETNALYEVVFPYKNNIELNLVMDLKTNQALEGNIISLNVFSIIKTYPSIDFLLKSSTQKSAINNVSHTTPKPQIQTPAVSFDSPFKFPIMTEKERSTIELILQKHKIPNSAFVANYEEKVFG